MILQAFTSRGRRRRLLRLAPLPAALILLGLGAAPALTTEGSGRQLFTVRIDGKSGCVDRRGQLVIAARFEGVGEFSEGLASAAVIERTESLRRRYLEGYIDSTGSWVVEPRFGTASEFSEGRAAVSLNQVRGADASEPTGWGYIDRQGAWVVEPRYSQAFSFSDGRGLVRDEEGRYGYVDHSGVEVIPARFENASPFADGLASVLIEDRYGFIDRDGRIAIAPRYTHPGSFSEGLALVRVGSALMPRSPHPPISPRGDYLFIDRQGDPVIRLAKEVISAQPFAGGRAAFTVIRGDEAEACGYLDESGQTVVPPRYTLCEPFSEGLAMVVDGKDGLQYIDRQGRVVLSPPFYLGHDFHGGLASVQEGRHPTARHGYIDRQGRVVWPPSR